MASEISVGCTSSDIHLAVDFWLLLAHGDICRLKKKNPVLVS